MVASLNSFSTAFLQFPQQTCTSLTVTLAALDLLAVFLVFISLPSQVACPKKPPFRRASNAVRAVFASVAVKVTVFSARSHLASETPSTLLRMPPTALTQDGQHRCTPLISTFSARAA